MMINNDYDGYYYYCSYYYYYDNVDFNCDNDDITVTIMVWMLMISFALFDPFLIEALLITKKEDIIINCTLHGFGFQYG